jgi:hypothetical protein
MFRFVTLTALMLTVGAFSAAAAGSIYFRDGRQVQADDWWEDAGTLYYVTGTMGQQADVSSNVVRVQGEPNWAGPYRTDSRILFKGGSFSDARFVGVGPQEILSIDGNTTTIWRRSDVIRIMPIPATERGCAATTITKKELDQTEEMVDWSAKLKGGQYGAMNNRLRNCLELRRQAMQGSKPDASVMARACCAE